MFIAALLSIIGYSINDTIVAFDKIRENLGSCKVGSQKDIENVVAYNTTKEYEKDKQEEYEREEMKINRNQILLSEDEIRKMDEKKGRK